MKLLLELDEASVAAVRDWFQRHRSSSRAALERAESHFEDFIQRARLFAEQKENLDEASKLLTKIQAHCENGSAISAGQLDSALLQSRLGTHKVRVEELLSRLDRHLEDLRLNAIMQHRRLKDEETASSLAPEDSGEQAEPNDPTHIAQLDEQAEPNELGEQVEPDESDEPQAELSRPMRRSHRQRKRANKWRRSVQISTPEADD
eukprot:CAMPEP_0117565876 /NCGR_PEP_ID=MMETSP0784-20121206/56799_1 /TAXON_ID=39447 /ORGANISM="" /LENGTH=204 /DNA_ID=CAMNT_0005363693 /DNA_START=33 /DNA_END=647 /DNA_ORIENTATION=-